MVCKGELWFYVKDIFGSYVLIWDNFNLSDEVKIDVVELVVYYFKVCFFNFV